MLLKNNCYKKITIDGIEILLGETKEIPDVATSCKVIQEMISNETLSVINKPKRVRKK